MAGKPLSRALLAQIRAGVDRNPGTPAARTIRLLLDELDRVRPAYRKPFPLDQIYLDVLICAANGQSMTETARTLHVADDAVRSRRKRIRQRLNVASIEQAIAVAIAEGWLPMGAIQIPDRQNGIRTSTQTPCPLTRRQKQVLVDAANGKTHKASSEHLGLTPDTVRTYRRRIHQQLGVGTVAQAVAVAVASGWIGRSQIRIPGGTR